MANAYLHVALMQGDCMTFAELYSNGYAMRSLAEKASVNHRTPEGYSLGCFPWKNSRLLLASKVAGALETNPDKLTDFNQ